MIEGEGNYVTPAIVEAENDYEIVQEETFAPILYLLKYRTEEEAIAMHWGKTRLEFSHVYVEPSGSRTLFECSWL